MHISFLVMVRMHLPDGIRHISSLATTVHTSPFSISFFSSAKLKGKLLMAQQSRILVTDE
jgi:hypothetical protein